MVWLFDINKVCTEQDFEKILKSLPPTRRKKAEGRTGAERKFVVAEYFCLKNILKFEGTPDFEYNKNGKPKLEDFFFSFAHCENFLCVAVSQDEVGVDIEKIRPCEKGVEDIVLNAKEKDIVKNAVSPDFEFTKLFVQKESAIKCLGLALKDIQNILSQTDLDFDFVCFGDFVVCECKKPNKTAKKSL